MRPPLLLHRLGVVVTKAVGFIVVCAAALVAAAPAPAAAPASYAGQCGLPVAQPIWADFGWPTDAFDAILGKPGIVIGAGSGAYPATMRATGAATVYFDLNFNKRIGTTTKPVDPSAGRRRRRASSPSPSSRRGARRR